jgi:hypothetical protein
VKPRDKRHGEVAEPGAETTSLALWLKVAAKQWTHPTIATLYVGADPSRNVTEKPRLFDDMNFPVMVFARDTHEVCSKQ